MITDKDIMDHLDKLNYKLEKETVFYKGDPKLRIDRYTISTSEGSIIIANGRWEQVAGFVQGWKKCLEHYNKELAK